MVGAVIIALGGHQQVEANPVNPAVVSGTASFVSSGNSLSVTNSANAIINWQGFSIGSNEVTRFIQPSASSQVLNRIIGGDPSVILGTLTSNGGVFLINPNGIVFGASAQVNVAGLVASSLSLSNADFLSGHNVFTSNPGASPGSVINLGRITTASGGSIYLIAPNVDNQGALSAPDGNIILAAGKTVRLVDPANPEIQTEITASDNAAVNLGQIVAGNAGIFGGIVKQRGTIEATGAALSQNGSVILKATDTTQVSGNIKAAGGSVEVLGNTVALDSGTRIDTSATNGGGTVLIGGDAHGANVAIPNAQHTTVAEDVVIHADATDNGDGGKVVVWSNQVTRMYGTITAKGGVNGGNGGWIETSGKQYLDIGSIAPDASAAWGLNGEWLLDPANITVVHGSANALTGGVYDPASTSSIGDSQINTALNGGTDVTIQTTAAGGGNIVINGTADSGGAVAITNSSTSNRSLTFNTSGTLTMDAGASIAGGTHSLNVSLNATGGNAIAGTINSVGGTITLGAATNLTSSATLANAIVSGGSIAVNNTTATLDGTTLSTDVTISNNGYLHLKNGLTFTGGHTITIGNGTNYGQLLYDNTETITGSGNIVFGSTNGYTSYLYANSNNSSVLTLDSGITVSEAVSASNAAGQLGYNTYDAIINKGIINATQANRTLTTLGSFTNDNSAGQGVINVANGTFNLGNATTSTWANTGTINVSSGILNLNGTFTTPNIGTINQSGTGTVNLVGALTNTSNTWNLGTTGLTSVNLAGTITGGTLTGGTLTTNNTTATLDGTTLSTDVTISNNGYLHLKNGLTFTGGHTITIGNGTNYGQLLYDNTETITGSGNIVFGSTNGYTSYLYANSNNSSVLTLDSGITVSEAVSASNAAGQLGYNTYDAIINKGIINATQANRTLTTLGSFTNDNSAGQGVINVANGTFNLGNATTSTWANTGTINVSSGILNLNGTFTTPNIGTINQSGTGTVNLVGALTNTSNTWNLGTTGLTSVNLAGTITGGTLTGGTLTTNNTTATLDGTTLSTDVTISNNGYLHLKNGLTFTGGHTITIGNGTNYGQLLYDNTETITGSGNIVFGSTNGYTSYLYANSNNSSVLTLDSGITVSEAVSASNAAGQLGYNTYDAIINKGIINATQANRTLTTLGSFTNDNSAGQGVINVANGTFNLGNATTSTWANTGTINVSSGILNLNGTFTTPNIGTINQSGTGTVNLVGALTNTSNTWNLGTTGLTSVNLAGTITGGTLTGGTLTTNNTTATLDGTTLSTDVTISNNGYLHLKNGLTFTGGHTITIGNGTNYGQLLYDNTETITGSGNIVFGSTNGYTSYLYANSNNSSVLTLDSGITVSEAVSASNAAGQLGYNTYDAIINKGIINATQANRTLTTLGSFTNDNSAGQGVINVANGTFNLGNATTSTWANTGTINVSSGILNLNGTFTTPNIGTINHTGGTLNVLGIWDLGNGSINIGNGGTFGLLGLSALSGTLKNGTLTGATLTSASGTLDGITLGNSMTESGTVSINNVLTLATGINFDTGASSLYFANGASIATPGSATLTKSGGGLYMNAVGGTSTIGSGITVLGYGSLSSGCCSSGTWVNNGTIDANQAGQSFIISIPSFTNGSTGAVKASLGTVSIQPGTAFTNSGSLTANGGTLSIAPTNPWTNGGSISVSSGTLNLGGTISLAGLLSSGGTFSHTGGAFNITGIMDLGTSSINIGSGGTFGTGGLSSLSGTLKNGTLTGATLTSASGTLDGITLGNSMTESGTVSINNVLTLATGINFDTGASSLYFANGASIATPGSATLTKSGGGLYMNAVGGTSTIGSGITVLGYGSLSSGCCSSGTWVNNGTIDANQAGQSFIISIPSFTNGSTGAVKASLGTVSIQPGTAFTNSGSLTANGGTLSIAPTNPWTNGGSISVSSGTLNLGGTISLAGLLSSGGTFSHTGGAFNITGIMDLGTSSINIGSGGTFGTGGLSSLSGTLKNGTLTGATLTSASGTLDGITLGNSMTESGTVSINNVLTLATGINFDTGASSLYFANGASIATPGSATLTKSGGGLYMNAVGGTSTIGSGITVLGYGSLSSGCCSSGTWVNNGTIDANQAGQSFNIGIPTFTNASGATIDIRSGATVSISSTTFNNNGAIALFGGTLSSTSANFSNPSGSTLSGYGTINMGSFTLTNNGAMQIGNPYGLLSISGNFTQGSTGTLAMEIAGETRGTLYDALDVTGTATLGGTLQVTHAGGFTPGTTEAFQLIRANTLSGTFATVTQPGGYTPLYDTKNLVLGIGVTGINEWINTNSSTWATTSNWSLGHTPTSSEVAIVDLQSASPTVTVGAAAGTVGALVSTETLTYVGGGSMTITGPLTETGSTLSLSGGTLVSNAIANISTMGLSSGTWTANGASSVTTLNFSGGTLAGTGLLTLTGASTWSGGTLADNLTVNNGVTFTLNSTATKYLGAATLTNNGTVAWSAGQILPVGNSTVNNNGLFDIQGDLTWGKVYLNGGGTNTTVFNNAVGATLQKSAGSAVLNLGSFDAGYNSPGYFDLNNAGTVSIFANTGTMRFYGGGTGTSSGVFQTASNGTLDFNNGVQNLISTSSFTGSGNLAVSGATFSDVGSYSATGSINISAGTATLTPTTAMQPSSISVSGGAVTFAPVGGFSAAIPTIAISGGSATFNVATNTPALTLSGGTLTGTGLLTLTGASTWSGGTLADNLTVNNGVTFTLNSTATKYLGAATLTNNGTVAWSAGQILPVGNSTVNNNGLFDIQGDLTWGKVYLNGGGTNTTVFNNAVGATLQKSAGSAVLNLGSFDAGYNSPGYFDLNNAGTVSIFANTGTMRFYGGGTGTSSGVFQTASNGTLDFNNGVQNLISTSSFTGSGNLAVSGATFSDVGSYSATGSINISAGTATLTPTTAMQPSSISVSGGAVTFAPVGGFSAAIPTIAISGGSATFNVATNTPALTLSGGTLTGTGLLTLTGASTWSGGTLADNLTVNNGVTFTLNSTATKYLGAATLTNNGTVAWSAGQILPVGNSTVNNNGLFDIQGDLTWGKVYLNGGGTNTTVFNNAVGATLQKSAGSAVLNLGSFDAGYNSPGYFDLNNAGTVSIFANTGTMRFYGGGTGTSSGVFQTASNGTLDFNNGVQNLISTSSFTGSGNLAVSGATFSDVGSYSATGSINISAGTATLTPTTAMQPSSISVSGGAVTFAPVGGFSAAIPTIAISGGSATFNVATNTPALTLSGGTLTGTGLLTLTGASTWSGGTLADNLTVNNGVTFTLNSTATKYLGAATLTNNGTVAWSAGQILPVGNSTVNNNGLFDIQGDLTWGKVYLNGGGTNTTVFNNAVGATLQKSAGSAVLNLGSFDAGYNSPGYFDLNNAGTVSIFANTGTMRFYQDLSALTNSGTFNLASGTVASVGSNMINAGIIQGTGTIDVGANTLTNNGTVNPGGTGTAGTLSITGNLVMGSSGVVNLEMGGTAPGSYDVLAVSGSATLGGKGTLNVSTIGVYTPAVSDSFNGLTAASFSGDFATKNLPLNFSANAGATAYSLAYTGVACLGTICFDNTDNNWLWSDPNNWNTDLLPVSSDDVYLSLAGTNTILYQSGSYTIASLHSSANNALSFTGGALTISGLASLTGNVSVAGGMLTLNGVSSMANLALAGGTLGGSGNITLSGSSSIWSSGTLGNGGGSLTVNPGATLTVNNIGTIPVLDGFTLNNQGTLVWASTATNNWYLQNGAVINNSGTFSIQSDGYQLLNNGGTAPAINNTGIFQKNGGTSTSYVGVAFNNNSGGSVKGLSGTLDFTGGGTAVGSFTVNTGDTVQFGGGTFTLNTGAALGGLGSYLLSSGILGAGGTSTVSNLNLVGGTLSGSGSIALTGASSTWSGSIVGNGGGSLTVNPGATLTVNNIGTIPVLDGFTLNNQGTLVWASTATNNWYLQNGAVINNSGTFSIQSDGYQLLNNGGTAPAINNTGIFQKNGGTSTSYVGVAFNNNSGGSVKGLSGTLDFTGGGTAVGSFTVNTGDTVQFGGGTFTLNTGAALGGLGSYLLSSGILGAGGTSTVSNLNLVGGTLSGSGSIALTGASSTWSGSIVGNGGGSLTVNPGATLTVNNIGTIPVLDGFTLNNQGTLVWASTATNNWYLQNGAVINNSGTFSIQSDGYQLLNNGGTAPAINNTGIFQKNGGTSTSYVGVAFNNNSGGSVKGLSGTLDFTGGGTAVGSFTVNTGDTVQFGGGTFTLNTGAALGGLGSYLLSSGILGAGGTSTVSNLNLVGGTLSGSGSIALTGASSTWSGSIVGNGGGSLTVNPGATLTVNNIGTIPVLDGFTLNNQGTLVWASTATNNWYLQNGAVINNSGTFSIQSDGYQLLNNGGTAPAINNTGIFQKNGGTSTSYVGVAFNNSGTVNVGTGTLQGFGGNNFTMIGGSVNAASGATFNMNGGIFDWQGGTLAGAGLISFSGGALLNATGSGAHVLNGQNLHLNSSTLTGSGSMDVLAGTLTLDNATTLLSGTSLTVSGGSVIASTTFDNQGLVSANTGSISLTGGGTHIGTFQTSGSGTIDFAGGIHNLGDGSVLDGPGILHSGGILMLTGTTTGTTIGSSGIIDLNVMNFSGSGNLSNAGTVNGSGIALAGDLTNQASGKLNLDNATIAGSLYNYGQFNVVANSVTVSGTAIDQNSGTMVIPVGTQLIKNSGVFTWSGGTIHGIGSLGSGSLGFTNGGTFQFGGNGARVIDGMNFTFNNLTLPNGSLTLQSGSLTLTGSTSIPVGTSLGLAGGAFTNDSTLNVAGNFSLTGGSFMGTGAINMQGGAMTVAPTSPITWTNSGLLTNTGSLDFNNATVTNQIDNQGTITVGNGVTFAQSFTNTAVAPGTGIVNIPSGTATFSSGYYQNSGTTTLGVSGVSTGNLVTGAGGFHLNGGVLGGTGTINGNLIVGPNSDLSPGYSPGSLTINGNLVLNSGSTLDIQLAGLLAGTQFDYINVTGSATLGGTLNVTSYNGYNPAPGTQYAFLNFGSYSGTFNATQIPGSFSGMTLSYLSNGLTLKVPALALPSAPALSQFDQPIESAFLSPLTRLVIDDESGPLATTYTSVTLAKRLDKETPSCMQ